MRGNYPVSANGLWIFHSPSTHILPHVRKECCAIFIAPMVRNIFSVEAPLLFFNVKKNCDLAKERQKLSQYSDWIHCIFIACCAIADLIPHRYEVSTIFCFGFRAFPTVVKVSSRILHTASVLCFFHVSPFSSLFFGSSENFSKYRICTKILLCTT